MLSSSSTAVFCTSRIVLIPFINFYRQCTLVCLYLNIIKAYTLPLPLGSRSDRLQKKMKLKIFKTIFSDMLSSCFVSRVGSWIDFFLSHRPKKKVEQTLQIFTDNHTILIFFFSWRWVSICHLFSPRFRNWRREINCFCQHQVAVTWLQPISVAFKFPQPLCDKGAARSLDVAHSWVLFT